MSKQVPEEARSIDSDVTELLEQIKAGMLQRRGEIAAIREERRQWMRQREQIRQYLGILAHMGQVEEKPFTSQVPVLGPVIAAFRTLWNNVSTRWYVLPMFHQQRLFNQAVVEVLRSLMETDSTILPEGLETHWEKRLFADAEELDLLARRVSELQCRIQRCEARVSRLNQDATEPVSPSEAPLVADDDQGNW
ncbi:MAG: hypothetical protein GX620_12340 [Chloroflexi bacterium]|nr:hypothetical protein [Chloroflexota bacterium]